MTHKQLYFFILILTTCVFPLQGQKYNFRHFGLPDLPDPVVYSLTQDKTGFLWVGTGTGLYGFDGFQFRKHDYPDTGSIRFATVLFCDNSGVVWIGGSDGSLHCFRDNLVLRIDSVNSQRINDIKQNKTGDIFVVTQDNGIFILHGNNHNPRVRHITVPDGLLLYSISFAGPDTLLVGTGENLILMEYESDTLIPCSVVEGIEYTRVSSVIDAGESDCYYAGTENYGVFLVEREGRHFRAVPVSEDDDLAYLRVQSLMYDRDGRLWVSTYGSGVIKAYFDDSGKKLTHVRHYNSVSGLAGDNVRIVFQDNEGNYWVGLYGEGLSQLVSEAFTSYQPGNTRDENNIIYIGRNHRDYIVGTVSGFHLFDLFTGTSSRFTSILRHTSGVPATSYMTGSDGRLWIGTGGAGLFVRDSDGNIGQYYKSSDAGENFISSITGSGNNIWLSTRNGIVVIDMKDRGVVRKFTTTDKLPHNNINQVFIDRTGNALVATEAVNIYYADLKKGIYTGNIEIVGSARNTITGFSQGPDGCYWVATSGNGVFYINGDSVNTLNTSNGMLSNFCYSIMADSEGRLWTGHERGFSRYDPETGVISVFSTSFAGGGDCNPNAIYVSNEGVIFIGTTNGLIVYDKKKDLKGIVPPGVNILSVTVNDRVYPYTPQLHLPYNRYVIRIDYVGISLSNPELVRYRTRLDNYDRGWSESGSQRHITYRVTDGTYRFSLEAVNESGVTVASENMLEIVVRTPFWRSWWFFLSAASLIVGGIIMIIRIREAAQKRMRLHLEELLRQRTSEVIRQKEEIEQQNTAITDSINYARRIQSSILPDVAKLKETFRDAFIIFIPRDIVSGDFYWFENLSNDRFVIVCADSTGHGVPGAFMSMIGSTLIQDIVTRKNVSRPSEILTTLDRHIFSTLNRNIDIGVSNDGMDMVICEINLKTRHIRFASAMRPVILIMSGEPIYVKGNRSSVGGMAYTDKFFDDQEYYLEEGDAIYMFSDGFPDQFGGESGRKMKVARLRTLIEEVMNLPMEEQKDRINRFFYEWKGDHEQVDDILFMGIRF